MRENGPTSTGDKPDRLVRIESPTLNSLNASLGDPSLPHEGGELGTALSALLCDTRRLNSADHWPLLRESTVGSWVADLLSTPALCCAEDRRVCGGSPAVLKQDTVALVYRPE